MLDALFWGREFYWLWRAPIIIDVRAIIISQHRALLVRHDYGDRRTWHLPGGAAKCKETLTDALRREIKEELNADMEIDRLHGVYHNLKPGPSIHIVVFIASLKNQTALKPSWEIAAFDFFDLNALPESTSPATRRRIEEYLAETDRVRYQPW